MNYESKTNLYLLISKVFSPSYSKKALEKYLKLSFASLSMSNNSIPFITFHKLMRLPLLISRHLYRVFSKGTSTMNFNCFYSGLLALYLGTFDQRLAIIFTICDCDQDGKIIKEDILLFLKYFHSFINGNKHNSSFDFIKDTINTVFNNYQSLTLIQLKQESVLNSDLVMLLIIYFNYTNPFKIQNVKLFEKKLIKTSKNLPSFNQCLKDVYESLSDSSAELFSYININFNENLQYVPVVLLDNNNDIESLDQFEVDLHKIIDDYGSFQKIQAKFIAINDDFESLNTRESSHNDIPAKHQTVNISKSCFTKTETEVINEPVKLNYNLNTLISGAQLFPCHPMQRNNNDNNSKEYSYLSIKGQLKIKEELTVVIVTLVNRDLFIWHKKTILEVVNMSNYQIGQETLNKEDSIFDNIDANYSIILLPKYSAYLTPKRIYCNDKNTLDGFILKAQTMLNQRKINCYYEFEREIYKGDNSYILKGKSLSDMNQTVAVKIISKKVVDDAIVEMIETEREIFMLLMNNNNENVIRALDVFETANFYYFVSEYLPNGTLTNYLDTKGFCNKEESFNYLMKQIVNGLKFLHSYGIIHRDLKSDNILISNDEDTTVYKITDFGLSKIVAYSEKATEPCGSLCYTAPEVLNQNPYTYSVDIWSLGVLLYFSWYRRFPFFDTQNNLIKITEKIKKGFYKFPSYNSSKSPISNISDYDVQRSITQCLQVIPANRPVFS